MSIDHLNEKVLDKVAQRLFVTRGSLTGLSGLFTQGINEVCLQGDQFYGVGQLLEKMSGELEILEDILRCGEDSMADERNGLGKNEEEDLETEEKNANNDYSNFESKQFSNELISLIKRFSTKKLE